MASASDYLDRLRGFALRLQADAERLDTDAAALATWYTRFRAEELHLGWSARQPLSGREFCEALTLLGEASGAFGFVVLQQFVANTHLAGRVPEGEDWPSVGVAFGHLRNPQGSGVRWDGCLANGFVPWLTGAGLFPTVVLGMRGPEDEEVYALVEAVDRPAFRHSAPLDLIAGAGTHTVSVQVSGLRIEAALLKQEPPGTFARNDIQGVLFQTPLMVGCIQACRALIRASSRVGAAEKSACELATERLLARVYAAFDHGTPEEGRQLRATVGDFTVRMARLAAMASGGVGLVRGHPAQRLYREALLYSLMAQTEAIIDHAFQEVFE